MKLVNKEKELSRDQVEVGDVVVTRGGAHYLIVSESSMYRCLRLDDRNGKVPLSLTAPCDTIVELLNYMFGSNHLTVKKDIEIHV